MSARHGIVPDDLIVFVGEVHRLQMDFKQNHLFGSGCRGFFVGWEPEGMCERKPVVPIGCQPVLLHILPLGETFAHIQQAVGELCAMVKAADYGVARVARCVGNLLPVALAVGVGHVQGLLEGVGEVSGKFQQRFRIVPGVEFGFASRDMHFAVIYHCPYKEVLAGDGHNLVGDDVVEGVCIKVHKCFISSLVALHADANVELLNILRFQVGGAEKPVEQFAETWHAENVLVGAPESPFEKADRDGTPSDVHGGAELLGLLGGLGCVVVCKIVVQQGDVSRPSDSFLITCGQRGLGGEAGGRHKVGQVRFHIIYAQIVAKVQPEGFPFVRQGIGEIVFPLSVIVFQIVGGVQVVGVDVLQVAVVEFAVVLESPAAPIFLFVSQIVVLVVYLGEEVVLVHLLVAYRIVVYDGSRKLLQAPVVEDFCLRIPPFVVIEQVALQAAVLHLAVLPPVADAERVVPVSEGVVAFGIVVFARYGGGEVLAQSVFNVQEGLD